MSPAVQSFIQQSLRVRSAKETHALVARTILEPVSMRKVIEIRRDMSDKERVKVSNSVSAPALFGGHEIASSRSNAERGSTRLKEAMERYYAKKAREHRVSQQGAMLAVLYSHDELQRMASVGR